MVQPANRRAWCSPGNESSFTIFPWPTIPPRGPFATESDKAAAYVHAYTYLHYIYIDMDIYRDIDMDIYMCM